jgi:hypothetical protein
MKTTYTFFEKIIIDNIDFEDYGFNNDMYLYDKIKTLYNIFKREYIHNNNKHLNEVFLFSEWLRGLPSVLTVPFYNGEILENALQYAKENNDKQLRLQVRKEESFLNDYWLNLARAFFTLKENL